MPLLSEIDGLADGLTPDRACPGTARTQWTRRRTRHVAPQELISAGLEAEIARAHAASRKCAGVWRRAMRQAPPQFHACGTSSSRHPTDLSRLLREHSTDERCGPRVAGR